MGSARRLRVWYQDTNIWIAISGWVLVIVAVGAWWRERDINKRKRVEDIVDARIGQQISDTFFSLQRTQNELEKRIELAIVDLSARASQANNDLLSQSHAVQESLQTALRSITEEATRFLSEQERHHDDLQELLDQAEKTTADLATQVEGSEFAARMLNQVREQAEYFGRELVRAHLDLFSARNIVSVGQGSGGSAGRRTSTTLKLVDVRVAYEVVAIPLNPVGLSGALNQLRWEIHVGQADRGLIIMTYPPQDGLEGHVARQLEDNIDLIHLIGFDSWLHNFAEELNSKSPGNTFEVP